MTVLEEGDVFEAVASDDPRGDYRIQVNGGQVTVGKSQQEARRGYGETVDKYNRAKVTVGESSESVWVYNPGPRKADLTVTKSGFLLDFFESTTNETASERDERNSQYKILRGDANLVPETEASNNDAYRIEQEVSDEWLSDFPNASGVLLTGLNLDLKEVSTGGQAQNVRATVMLDDPNSINLYQATISGEDSNLSLGDGERIFVPMTGTDSGQSAYYVYIYIDNYGLYQGNVTAQATFRVIE